MKVHWRRWLVLGFVFSFSFLFGCGDAEDEASLELRTASSSLQSYCGEASQTILMAGRTIEAGIVEVGNDDENLYVTFKTIDGGSLVETHVAVAGSLAGIAQTNTGNPIPGRFEYKAQHEPGTTAYTYIIAVGDFEVGQELFIAAHAVVELEQTGGLIRRETGWGAGPGFPGRNWAMYFNYTVQECDDDVAEYQGCTPGYWRQAHHLDSWVDISPNDSFNVIVARNAVDGLSMVKAVELSGGGLNALVRHTAAALLNATNPDVNFPFTLEEVISDFQAAFDSGDFEATKDAFQDANELGCPLS